MVLRQVTGEANAKIAEKDDVMRESTMQERQEKSAARPKTLVDASNPTYANLNFDMTVVGFTKIMWRRAGQHTVREILKDPALLPLFRDFIKARGSIVACYHVDFFEMAETINRATYDRDRVAKKLHRKMEYNPLFYCTTNEIVVVSRAVQSISVWKKGGEPVCPRTSTHPFTFPLRPRN